MSLFPLNKDECLRVVAVVCSVKNNTNAQNTLFDAKIIFNYLKDGSK